jgi:hypothetical protein
MLVSGKAVLCPPSYTFLLLRPRWLQADTALGISLARHRLVSAHHADDTKVYVPDLQEDTVKHLLKRNFLFGQASGQYVNPAKSSAVPLNGLSVPATPVAGVTVVASATSLGVLVQPVTTTRLQNMLMRVQACVYGEGGRLSHLPSL